MTKLRDEYWDEFIPAMLPTRLGSSTDGDPQLAAAWLGWQERRKIDDATIAALEAEYAAYRSDGEPELRAAIVERTALEARCRELEAVGNDLRASVVAAYPIELPDSAAARIKRFDDLTASETAVEQAWIDDGAGGLVNLGMALSKNRDEQG